MWLKIYPHARKNTPSIHASGVNMKVVVVLVLAVVAATDAKFQFTEEWELWKRVPSPGLPSIINILDWCYDLCLCRIMEKSIHQTRKSSCVASLGRPTRTTSITTMSMHTSSATPWPWTNLLIWYVIITKNLILLAWIMCRKHTYNLSLFITCSCRNLVSLWGCTQATTTGQSVSQLGSHLFPPSGLRIYLRKSTGTRRAG